MKQYLKNGFIAVCFVLLLCTNIFSEPGVFNAKITLNERTHLSADISVTAEIGADDAPIMSVNVCQTTADGQPLEILGQMYDDGTHGDKKKADAVFTMQHTLSPPAKSEFYVRITAAYKGIKNEYMSPVMEIVTNELPFPIAYYDNIDRIMQDLEKKFYSYLPLYGIKVALEMVLQDAKGNPNITSAALAENYLSINYRGVMNGVITLNDPAWGFLR